YRLGRRPRRVEGNCRVRDGESRRGSAYQGAWSGACVQGRAGERDRAGLVHDRYQPRFSHKRCWQYAEARNPDGTFRCGRRSRWRAAAACVGRRCLHDRNDRRYRRRADCIPEGGLMDFTLSPEIEDLRKRVRAFVEDHVLPLEADPKNFSDHENIPDDRLAPVRAKARSAGLWAPQSPKKFGGMELPIVAWAVMYEEAARSLFGPLAFNCMAPDDGNMNV